MLQHIYPTLCHVHWDRRRGDMAADESILDWCQPVIVTVHLKALGIIALTDLCSVLPSSAVWHRWGICEMLGMQQFIVFRYKYTSRSIVNVKLLFPRFKRLCCSS